MNHNGELRRDRELHLRDEYLALHIARRMVVEVVEADFSPRNHALVLRQLLHALEIGFGREARFVRMHAESGENLRISSARALGIELLRQLDGTINLSWTIAVTDCDDCLNASLSSALQHRLAIRAELGSIKMAVGINEHW